jgi:hypothetical protein
MMPSLEFKHAIQAENTGGQAPADAEAVCCRGGQRCTAGGQDTLLQHELPDWDAVVFDPAVDVANARQDPDLFLDNHPVPLILDEIQYAPEVVAAIKRRVDRPPGSKKASSKARGKKAAAGRRPGQYVLTGSQQWSGL